MKRVKLALTGVDDGSVGGSRRLRLGSEISIAPADHSSNLDLTLHSIGGLVGGEKRKKSTTVHAVANTPFLSATDRPGLPTPDPTSLFSAISQPYDLAGGGAEQPQSAPVR